MTHDEDDKVPVIDIWDFLLVPLQGDITDSQAEALREATLNRIQTKGSRSLIIDASGLALVDSHLCALLADLARAAKLMGTRTLLCGLDPGVAQTLMEMDMSLQGIECVMSLEQAFSRVGIGYLRPQDESNGRLVRRFLDTHNSKPNPA